MANRLLLDLDDYVRVINTTGKAIEGRYDGIDYEFPDAQEQREAGAQEYVDVHKSVAQHIFGFGLPDQAEPPFADRTQCLFRLGWTGATRATMDEGLNRLKKGIQFHPVPQFPTSVLEFKKQREDESVARVPSPTMGPGAAEGDPASLPVAPKDPFAQPKAAGKK